MGTLGRLTLSFLVKYCSLLGWQVAVFFGGLSIKKDEEVLKKNCPHIVVGTPGRILALARNKSLNLKHIKHFILDECDKMLEQLGKLSQLGWGWSSDLGSCLLEPNDAYLILEHFSARMTLNLSPMTDGSGFPGQSLLGLLSFLGDQGEGYHVLPFCGRCLSLRGGT